MTTPPRPPRSAWFSAALALALLAPLPAAAEDFGRIDDGQGLVLDWHVVGLDGTEQDHGQTTVELRGIRSGDGLDLSATARLPDDPRLAGGEVVLRIWTLSDGDEVTLAEDRARAEPGMRDITAALALGEEALSGEVQFAITAVASLRAGPGFGFGAQRQEIAVRGLALAPLVSDPEPNDSRDAAAWIELDAPLQGRLGDARPDGIDTQDWFAVQTHVPGRLAVGVQVEPGLELQLRLQDLDTGREVVADASGATAGSRSVLAPALAAGRWAIQLQRTAGTGSYTLTPAFTPAPEVDEAEPNDSRDAAQWIDLDAPHRALLGYGSPTRTDSEDWFRIVTSTPGTLEILAEADEGAEGLAFRLNLYPAAETRVVAGDTSGAASLRRAATAGVLPGEWLIQVQRTAGHGAYTLTPRFHPAPNGASQVLNATRDAAEAISLNHPVPRLMGYAAGTARPDGEDWLRLRLHEEGSLTVRLRPDGLAEGVEPVLLLALDVYQGGTNRTLGADAQGRSASREVAVPGLAAGDVFLRIRRTDGFGGYTVQADFTPSAAAPDAEPNDFRDSAAWLALGEEGIEGRIGFAGPSGRDEWDWFRLPVDTAGTLTLALTPLDPPVAGAPVTVQIHLHQPGQSRAVATATEGAGAERRLEVPGVGPGDYLVGLRATAGATGYRLAATLAPTPGAADPEPNDSREQAAPMATEGRTTGHIGHVTPGGTADDHDWFRLTTDRPGALVLDLTPAEGARDLAMELALFAPGQTRALASASEGTAAVRRIALPALEAGEWLVHVRRRAGSGGYALDSTVTPAPEVAFAGHASRDSAAAIAPGDTGDGLLGYGGAGRPVDSAWFALRLDEPGTLSVRAAGEGGLALRLHLLRAGETRALSSDAEGVSARRQVVASGLAAGLYLVHVQHVDGAGRFALETEFTPRD